jgi:hypothetical protein
VGSGAKEKPSLIFRRFDACITYNDNEGRITLCLMACDVLDDEYVFRSATAGAACREAIEIGVYPD